jgi:hypothetical protein
MGFIKILIERGISEDVWGKVDYAPGIPVTRMGRIRRGDPHVFI